MKTERLYYSDCYLREFEGRILRLKESEGRFRVYLDRTGFYPESGGQPADSGRLGGIPVLAVEDEGDEIAHVLSGRPEADAVNGAIDWPRRFDHMQQHTGQHILSAAFEKEFGYKTVSFHLGEEASTIDLNSSRTSRRQVQAGEDLANEVIFEDRPVTISFRSNAEAAALDLRKPVERQGELRLVEIAGFDLSACGGTHVARTGAVGLILARGMEQSKGMTRVEFVCGRRALRSVRSDYLTLDAAARELSTGFESVPALIRKRAEEFRASARIREKLSARLTDYIARELFDSATVMNGRRIVRRALASDEVSDVKTLAHALVKFPQAVAILGGKGQPATLCFAQSPGGPSDMGDILKKVVGRFGGKGGGTRDFAQGGGLDATLIEAALRFAEGLIA